MSTTKRRLSLLLKVAVLVLVIFLGMAVQTADADAASYEADGRLNGVVIRDVNSGEESVIQADGIFVSIGRKPATDLVKGQLVLDEGGYIIADETTRTNIPGVFAVGDVRTKALRQVVTAVADGANAVHFAEEYLA